MPAPESPHPWSVRAQCGICHWSGHVEPRALTHNVVGVQPPQDKPFMHNDCPACGARKLLDISTQAPSHA